MSFDEVGRKQSQPLSQTDIFIVVCKEETDFFFPEGTSQRMISKLLMEFDLPVLKSASKRRVLLPMFSM